MKNSTDITTTRRFPALASVRDELRERRQARAQYRAEYRTLARDLASYTTRSEVDDLLAAMEGETGHEAEQIRDILSRNLQQRSSSNLIAS